MENLEYIEYVENIEKSELKSRNIVIENGVKVGRRVKIGVNVCLLKGTYVGDEVEINCNSVLTNCHVGNSVKILSSYIEDSEVSDGCNIGPFAHIRNGSFLGKNCRIGNFVEIKNSYLGEGCKVAHLSYIGDAKIGKNCNVGCGVVFCNYNGKIKQRCCVGDNVFIGSNVNLIAPLSLGDNSFIAAGSTLNKDVKVGEFAIARSRQENKTNFKNPYIEKDE